MIGCMVGDRHVDIPRLSVSLPSSASPLEMSLRPTNITKPQPIVNQNMMPPTIVPIAIHYTHSIASVRSHGTRFPSQSQSSESPWSVPPPYQLLLRLEAIGTREQYDQQFGQHVQHWHEQCHHWSSDCAIAIDQLRHARYTRQHHRDDLLYLCRSHVCDDRLRYPKQ